MKSGLQNELILSAIMFGFATYIRTETLVLITMIIPLIFVHLLRQREQLMTIVKRLGMFIIIPVAFYFICMHVFVALFVPIPFNFSEQINPDLKNFDLFFERLNGITGGLVLSRQAIDLWGYFIYIFACLLIIDLIWKRKFNQEARIALYGIVVVYVGIAFLGYLIPHVDLNNTSKRSMFKLFPLMLFYMANSNFLLFISERLKRLEYKETEMRTE